MDYHTTIDDIRTEAAVRGMLRDIGYVLSLTRELMAEIEAEKCELVRPEMSEFCSVDATFAV